jgi:hypothetical protein
MGNCSRVQNSLVEEEEEHGGYAEIYAKHPKRCGARNISSIMQVTPGYAFGEMCHPPGLIVVVMELYVCFVWFAREKLRTRVLGGLPHQHIVTPCPNPLAHELSLAQRAG